jgi:hypothetical protein
MAPNPAAEIVSAILDNLKGRKGIGHELDLIEHDYPEVYQEMYDDLVETVWKTRPWRNVEPSNDAQ